MTVLTAIMLAMSAGVVGVAAEGTDPLDPSDGGADWDGDGLTNAEEQNHGTNFQNPDSEARSKSRLIPRTGGPSAAAAPPIKT